MRGKSIVLGVTANQSIGLLRGFPHYLRERGWDVHVVSAPGPLLESLASQEGVTVHAIEMKREPSILADLRSLFLWTRLLMRVRPSVVMTGTPKAGFLGNLAGLLARTPRRIYMLRGLRLETTTGLQRGILASIERLTASAAHKVLAVSPSLARQFVSLGLAPERKLVVLGAGSSNGVNVASYDREALPAGSLVTAQTKAKLHATVPVVGFVGRLTLDKGLDLLLDAVEILQSKAVPFQLLLVGGVDSSAGASLVAQLTRLGPHVSAVGHVPDPRPYFHLMDVLCLPTAREGFPNVVLQAAACGVPTVTTKATGAIDSVIDGVTGLQVNVGDARALADALASLVSDPTRRKLMGEAALERVRNEFEQSLVWERTHAFLENPEVATPGTARHDVGEREQRRNW